MSPSDDGFAFAVIALASAANRRCTLSDQPHLTKPNLANVAERCSLLRGGVETFSAVLYCTDCSCSCSCRLKKMTDDGYHIDKDDEIR